MDIGVVHQGWHGQEHGDKSVSAVEFGGGAVWEMMAVEATKAEGLPNGASRPAEEWIVAKSKASMKLERKRERAVEERMCEEREVMLAKKIDERIEIDAELGKRGEGSAGLDSKLKVIGMVDEKIQIEVDVKFIGNVVKSDKVMAMIFQAAGVKKALAAVSRICKAGNIVQFGDEPSECFIKHKATGKKVMMEKRRGSYVLKVEFVKQVQGGSCETWEKISEDVITIDSGAEESVCPLGWGQEFGLSKVQPGQEMTMVNAAGGEMPHYGSRKVFFKAMVFRGKRKLGDC
jgi:hypothetical protein